MVSRIVLRGDGASTGCLIITGLPRGRSPEHDSERDADFVREAETYRFMIECDGDISGLEPAELFDFDDTTLRTGRLNAGEAVGLVDVLASLRDGSVLRGRVDVRAAKFADEQAFSTMLSDLAARSVDVLHQGFAPSGGTYRPASELPASMLYQRFAILSTLLNGSELNWAIQHVIARPHRSWEAQQELRRPGQPARGTSRLGSQLAKPGRRVPSPRATLPSLPHDLHVPRTAETLDTIPNRFVRFVLEGWRALAAEVEMRAALLKGAPQQRGVAEATHIKRRLDELLASPLFREVAPLSVFPGDNQVLRRREGYRQILGAAVLTESSVGLSFSDIEDPFLVSRRSVATLYEYWTFVRLADAVASVWQGPDPGLQLFQLGPTGMSLVLRANGAQRLRFQTRIQDRTVRAELSFNRTFSSTESWTQPMRPDASLVILPEGGHELWLHFDAKYKVDWKNPLDTGDPAEAEEAERFGQSKRTDILKMHAYRDAIRASAGSYILFPGSETAKFTVDSNELLPGLGAFPLRPQQVTQDVDRLKSFLHRILNHVASSGTKHRRATFWTSRAYRESGSQSPRAEPPFGNFPPADTPVMVGYVRSSEQWAWICQTSSYNVRSGSRIGAVELDQPVLDPVLVLLYRWQDGVEKKALFRRSSPWRGASSEGLLRLGYPQPRGDSYLVCSVEEIPTPDWTSAVDVGALRPHTTAPGEPFTLSWLDLALSIRD